MKRRSATLLLATAALLATVGVQAQDKVPYNLKPGKPYAGTTLRVLLVGTPQFKGLELRADEFTKLTGINVTWDETTFGALQEKVSSVGVAADGTYDVVNYLDSWGPPNSRWFVELGPLLKRDGISMDRYPPAFAKSVTYDGKIMGLPLRSHVQLFYYRKDIFDKLNLTAPKTWADVVTSGKAIQKAMPGMGGVACNFGADGNRQNLYLWLDFLRGAGADVFDAKGNPAWETPAGIQATKDYIALNTVDKVCAPGSVSALEQDSRIVFMQGKAAMLPIWSWAYSPLISPESSTLKPEQVGFAEMPSYKGAPPVSLTNSMPYSISKYSKNQDAAWEFMKWLSNPDLEKKNGVEKTVNGVNTASTVFNHKASFTDADINAANANVPKAAAVALAANAAPLPMTVEWPEIGDILSIAINKAASGNGDVEQLMKAAAKDTVKVLRRSRR